MPFFDDDSLGGLGGTLNGIGSSLNNASRNPLFLAGLQMLANGSPQINKVPNTLEGVPNLMLAAGTQQKKYDDDAKNTAAMMQALQGAGLSPTEASTYAKNPVAAKLALDTLQQRKNDTEAERYAAGPATPTPQPQQQAPAPQQAAAAPAPQQQAAPAPQPQQPQVVDPQQQALDAAAKKFDDFGLASVGKTVEGFAASLGDPNKAARFTAAAQAQGLQPNSPITGPVLSDPAKSGPLARAAGVLGDDVPDAQFQAAHAQALQVSRERQAARTAQQQQFQKNVQGGQPAQMVAPQQQAPAPQPQPVAPQTATERALEARDSGRKKELQAQIDYNTKFLNSKNANVKAQAEMRIKEAHEEMKQEAPTSDIKEYQYAKKQALEAGEKEFPSYTTWLRDNKRASATLIRTDEGMEAAQIKARLAIDTDSAKKLSEAAVNGRKALPILREIAELADKTPQGFAGQVAPTVGKVLSSMGMAVPDGVSNAELFKSLSRQLVPAIRDPGSTSNFEQQMYIDAVPSLGQSTAGRKKVVAMMEAQVKRNVELADAYRDNVGSPNLNAKLAEIDAKPMFTETQRAELKRAIEEGNGGKKTAPASSRQTAPLSGATKSGIKWSVE